MRKWEAQFKSEPLDSGAVLQYVASITEEPSAGGGVYYEWELHRVFPDGSRERRCPGGMWHTSLSGAKRAVRECALFPDGRIKWREVGVEEELK